MRSTSSAVKYRFWTEKQTKALLDGIGAFGWAALKRKTGHSEREIWDKVRREFGGGGITRGSYSLSQAQEETGYARSQLERAAAALNQRWQRTSKRGNYLITAEQLEDLANWLAQDFWCRKFHLYNCVQCGKSVFPHYSLGYCKPCHSVLRRYVLTTIKVPFTSVGIKSYVDTKEPPEQDRLFYQLVLERLNAGRGVSIEQLEKVRSWKE